MPIVNHILEQSIQANGGANCTLRMYDQDAREYTTTWYGPPGFNNEGKVSMTITEMDEQLKQTEFETIFGAD